ncbi:MAG: transcription antitermination factor NusB [Bacillota bacterium]|jgi:N utilization substance protein B|nr:transcription antitermination factor NusB [Bacillota bacterium]HAN87337.1 transcription antitermination factor NusB [Bacillota bacterium]
MRSERRRAREAAMRALYQMDMSGCSPEWAVAFAVNDSADLDLPERARSYAVELVMGAVERIREIDEIMTGLSHDWAVSRMSPTDRNIMRIAVWEMLYLKDVPVAAAIDEAVEIAKLYGTADSPRFVNGILGALAERIKDGQASAGEPVGGEEGDGEEAKGGAVGRDHGESYESGDTWS